MNKAKEELFEEIASTEEIIEFKKIEKLVLANDSLNKKIDDMFEAQKQAINAKELGLDNAYLEYKEKYESILNSLKEDVLFNQYLSLKNDVKEVLNLVISIIENEIKKKINNC